MHGSCRRPVSRKQLHPRGRARSVCNRLVGPLENVPMLLRPKLSAVVLLCTAFVVCFGAAAVLCWNRPLFGLWVALTDDGLAKSVPNP